MHVSRVHVIILLIITNAKHDLGSDARHMGTFLSRLLRVAVVVRRHFYHD